MFVYLDTETTGLSASRGDKIVEISIIDDEGRVLIDTLVNPERSIPYGAKSVHGINDLMVASSPILEEILPDIDNAIRGKEVIIYNSNYDIQFFPDRLRKASRVTCAMKAYSNSIGSRRWIKLVDAAQHVGHMWQGEARRALADTQACRSVWHWLLQRDENIGGETRETPKTRMKWKNHLIEKKIIICRSCRVSMRVSVPTGKRGRVTCPKCGEKNAIV